MNAFIHSFIIIVILYVAQYHTQSGTVMLLTYPNRITLLIERLFWLPAGPYSSVLLP